MPRRELKPSLMQALIAAGEEAATMAERRERPWRISVWEGVGTVRVEIVTCGAAGPISVFGFSDEEG